MVKPKLRPVRQAILVLTWCFTGLAGWRSGYFKVSGIGTPMRLEGLPLGAGRLGEHRRR